MPLSVWSRGARRGLVSAMLLAILVCGCGKPRTPSTEEAVEQTETTTPDPNEKTKQIIPIRRNVTELDGNWVMVVTSQASDNYLWIMKISKGADGKSQCQFVDTSNDKFDPVLESSTVEGKSVQLKLKNKITAIEFQGEFDGVAIRGTLTSGPQDVYMARFLPTEAAKLAGYAETALPPAADLYRNTIAAMKTQPDPRVLLQLAKENSTSPVTLETLFGMVNMQARAGFDDAISRDIIAEYIRVAKLWGPRMQIQAELVVAQQLVTSGRMPADAIKHLDDVEKLMGPREELLKPGVKALREQAGIQASLAKIKSESEEDRAAAFAELSEAIKKQPYNAEILLALGEYSQATKQVDSAIDSYSTIVALPLLEQFILMRRAGQPAGDPTPRDLLKTLWVEKHGSEEGLESRLAEIYDQQIGALREQLRKAVPVSDEAAGNHKVLVEYFTGGQMPPSVGSEIAIDALRDTYPDSSVIVLRYHQHLPGADGMVNQDSEDRFAFYEMSKIPGLAINGAILDPDKSSFGGYLQHSSTAYGVLRVIVDPRRKQSTPVEIELSGRIENGELTVDAAVTGVKEEELPALRLRLAIAEESVDATTPNGIRHHAMLVREMPGGARGIAPKKGELRFSYSMPAGDIQQHLDEYLRLYENGKKIEIPADQKPAVRGPLYLVAWVQNDKVDQQHPEIGRAVLQSAIVRIEGDLPDAPTGKEPATPELKPVDPDAKPDAEKPQNNPASADESTSADPATPPAPARPIE